MSSIDTTSEFLLNIVAEKGGTVPSDLSGRYHAATQIEVMVTPDPGYSFYKWTVYWHYPDVFPDTSFSNPYQLTMPDCDVTMVATFGKSSELFSVTYADGPGGGFAGGMVAQYTGNYYVGSEVPIPWIRVFPGYERDKIVAYSSDGEVLWTKYDNAWAPTFKMPACDVIIMVTFKEI
jgi:hypothetical protein